jgi:hypothetical protein
MRSARNTAEALVGSEHLVKNLVQKPGVDGISAAAPAMADGVLKARFAQEGCVDEARKHRLLALVSSASRRTCPRWDRGD